MTPDRESDQRRPDDGSDHAADVPEPGNGIAFVNVAPDGVGLVAENQPERFFDFAEVLQRINPYQCPSRTVFFAGIRRTRSSGWVQRCSLAQIALDGNHG